MRGRTAAPGTVCPARSRLLVYRRVMVYVLGAIAIVAPVLLVVQTLRGRVRVRCCTVDAAQDARMQPYVEH